MISFLLSKLSLFENCDFNIIFLYASKASFNYFANGLSSLKKSIVYSYSYSKSNAYSFSFITGIAGFGRYSKIFNWSVVSNNALSLSISINFFTM